MHVKIAEARNQFTKLIRTVEQGEAVVITRNACPSTAERREVVLGGMKDRIKLLPGWNKPIGMDGLLSGDL